MKNLLNLEIGQQVEFKPAFITYTVYRKNSNIFYIDHTSDGWMSATVTKSELEDIVEGEKDFTSLDWK
jgi:hypothetical protein